MNQSTLSEFENAQNLKLNFWSIAAGVGLIAMEVSVLTIIYLAISPIGKNWVSIVFTFFIVEAISHAMTRSLASLKIKRGVSQIFFMFWLIFSVWFSLKTIVYSGQNDTFFQVWSKPFVALFAAEGSVIGLLNVIAVLLVILRGVWLADAPIDSKTVLQSFQVCILLMFLVGLFFSSEIGSSIFVIFVFLFFALIALSSARVAELGQSRGGKLPTVNSSWWLAILSGSSVVIIIGLVVGWLLGVKLADAVTVALFVGLGLVILTAVLAATPLLLVIYVIFEYVLPKAQNIPLELNANQNILQNPFTQEILADVENLEEIANVSINMQSIVLSLIFIGLLVAIFSLLKRRPWLKQTSDAGVKEQTTTLPPSKRRFGFLNRNLFQSNKSINEYLIASRIRKIYAQFLKLCADLGTVRKPAQTPLEFLVQTYPLFPDQKMELELITSGYLKVRYGGAPDSEEAVNQIYSAWKTVEDTGKQLKKIQKNRKK